MKKLFAPCNLALKLKELGFNEPCFGVYINGRFYTRYKSTNSRFNPNQKLVKTNVQYCTAPTWQQIFDWFREKYNLLITISGTGNKGRNTIGKIPFWFQYKIEGINEKGLSNSLDYINPIYGVFVTYEGARQAGLEKLIQIIEDENKFNTN